MIGRFWRAIPWGWVVVIFLQFVFLQSAYRLGQRDGFRDGAEAMKLAIFGVFDRLEAGTPTHD